MDLAYLNAPLPEILPSASNVRDSLYTKFLDDFGIHYRTDNYYIHVGEPTQDHGWILHLSVVPFQMNALLGLALPKLLAFGLPFKVIKNAELHVALNGGEYGTCKIGKIITIYVDNELIGEELLDALINLTDGFTGPEVFTDVKLGNIIYVRYGSFLHRIALDTMGNKVIVMQGEFGDTLVDYYTVPGRIPYNVSNPFLKYIDINNKEEKKDKHYLIGGRYLPVKLLKRDSKGDVWKGLYVSKYLVPKWCVIKQGRTGMFPDDLGRDARHRVEWQFHLNRALEPFISNARVVDLVTEDGEVYLVTEFIRRGVDVIRFIFTLLRNKPWYEQPASVREEVIGLLLQILTQVRSMHEKGYVHRDITGTNFLVDRKGSVKLIDLELSYSIREQHPKPAFGLGTFGFMSPKQVRREVPEYPDDLYSIGALLLMVFTGGLFPYYFVDRSKELLIRKLMFFVREEQLVGMILGCLESNPTVRPTINEVIGFFEELRHAERPMPESKDLESVVDRASLMDTIKKGIATLGGRMLLSNGLWHSIIETQYGPDVYPLNMRTFFSGLYRGVGGILWFLARSQRFGLDVAATYNNCKRAIEFLEEDIATRLGTMTSSYYYGKPGLAVAIVELLEAGLITQEGPLMAAVDQCFSSPVKELNLIHGVAGQGLSVMKCEAVLGRQRTFDLATKYAQMLLRCQQHDGSWLSNTAPQDKVNGFGYGIAGISYFLLRYGQCYFQPVALQSAQKGMRYLIDQRKISKNGLEWFHSRRNRSVETWWCNGGPGIALTFLKGYEITGEKRWLEIAEKILDGIPERLIYQNLSQCHGLSGLGEIYLEAFRVTGDRSWKQRANWLANVIIHQARASDTGDLYWTVELKEIATGDFMIGISGILHFLLRCAMPNDIEFPLL